MSAPTLGWSGDSRDAGEPGSRMARRTPGRRRTDVVFYVIAAAMVCFALLGPELAPHDPAEIIGQPYIGPGPSHLLGTDHLGRDVWSRVLAGGRSLLILPFLATALTAVIGAALGTVAGYLGGWVDRLIGAITGLLLVIPAVLILLLVIQAWGYNDLSLVVVVAATGVPFVTRLARASTLRAARSGYVEQAVGFGESTGAILAREIAPNIAGPLLADAGMRLVTSMDIIAAAAFLGLGPAATNWASMVSENTEGMTAAPWSVAAPALALALLAVSVNIAMDRLTKGLIR